MPNMLLLYEDVCSMVKEVLIQTEAQITQLGNKRYVRLLQLTTSFAERQFGNRIPGKTAYAYNRDDGNFIDNWDVGVGTLFEIYFKLGEYLRKRNIDSMNPLAYLQKALAVLESWRAHIDLSKNERIDVLDENKIEMLFQILSTAEEGLCRVYHMISIKQRTIASSL
jgi:hypothetical protein